jgi:hypothetical protein
MEAKKLAFERVVDTSCSRLIESYRLLLKRSQIEDNAVQPFDQFQIHVCAETIVS